MSDVNDSGAVLCSNFEVIGTGPSNAGLYGAVGLHVGQITEILYIDHPNNHSKRYIEYNALISDDNTTMSQCTNCRALESFGDENNFTEEVYTPVTEGRQQKKDDTVIPQYKNGALILIAYIAGFKGSPIILGGIQHPNIKSNGIIQNISNVIGTSPSIDSRLKELPTLTAGSKSPPNQSQSTSTVGATENDGQRILGEFNGVRWNINPLGELTIIFQGLKNTKGNLQNSAVQPTIIKINKDGEFFVIDNLNQEIKISRKDEAITITDGKTNPNIITIDRKNDHITVKSVKTVQVVAPEVDLVADTSIITGRTVKIGGKDADERAVLGNQFMKLYNALVNAFLSHTHFVASTPGFSSPTTSIADNMTAPKHLSQNVLIDKIFSGKPDLS